MFSDFRKINGDFVDLSEHTKNIISSNPDCEIHVGSDSQNYKNQTTYSVVVAYRLGTNGVHYIYHKVKVEKIKDRWTKLLKEAELSIEVAEWLTSNVDVDVQIDMDFNENESFYSNRLVQLAKGWANSLGYKVNVKPNIQIATKAADFQCR
jgi:predicted RNase H-related nuclease YkuK (DUF458 family)